MRTLVEEESGPSSCLKRVSSPIHTPQKSSRMMDQAAGEEECLRGGEEKMICITTVMSAKEII